MATNPTLLTQPIAANGAKNVIPNTTSTAGAMSQDQGFPAETALPLGAGGVAPTREDFNGAFNLLSGIAFMAQKGWVFLFDKNQNYFAGCVVRDTDGKLYTAINDVPASSTHPANDATNWKIYDLSAYTKTVNSPMFNKRDVITTSGKYTAPVTGWYKITVKGGGGGGAGGWGYIANNFYQAGFGGAEGGLTTAYTKMTAGQTANIVIGAGGIGSVGSTTNLRPSGSNGGNTTVTINGTTYTGGGGAGAGSGGTGSIVGNPAVTGSALVYRDSSLVPSDRGLIGPGGAGNGGAKPNYGDGLNGNNGGGGGGGSVITNRTVYKGGNGGNGYVWFEYFDSSLNP